MDEGYAALKRRLRENVEQSVGALKVQGIIPLGQEPANSWSGFGLGEFDDGRSFILPDGTRLAVIAAGRIDE